MVEIRFPHLRSHVRWGKFAKAFFWIHVVVLTPPTIIALGLLSYINYFHYDLDKKLINNFINYKPPLVTQILYRDGEEMVKFPGIGDWNRKIPEYRQWASYDQIPKLMRDAIFSAEDQRFFTHSGLEYRGLLRAFLENCLETIRNFSRTGQFKLIFAEGASTLTQQAIELTLLSEAHEKEIRGELSKWDKFKEKINKMRMAVWLEVELAGKIGEIKSKERIFEIVANVSYCGHGQYGVVRASEFFFGKKLTDITITESASIASLFRSPDGYSPYRNEVALIARRNGILKVMADLGYISKDELEKFYAEKLSLVHHKNQKIEAPAALQLIMRELWSKGSNVIKWENGVRVVSTIDLRAQRVGNYAVRYGLGLFRERQINHSNESTNLKDKLFFDTRASGVQSALVVLQNGTGEILAMVGGASNDYTSFNRAVDALRQPGSTFKPFVYGTAIESGNDVFKIDCLREGAGNCKVSDSPISVKMGRGKPRHYISNYDGRVFGSLPVWVAFARSQNMAAMHLARRVGMKSVINFANRLGLNLGNEEYPTTAIGAEEVTVLKLTAAFSTFPFYGVYSTPYIVQHLSNNLGESVTYNPNLYPAIQPAVALTISELLRHPILYRSGTARTLNDKNFNIPIAGKTGTTNMFRDAWFCGFTYGMEGITVCAWVGMDDRTPLGTGRDDEIISDVNQRCSPLHPKKRDYCEAGGKTALPIVKYFMEKYYRHKTIPQFPDGMDDWVRYVHEHDYDPTH